MLVSNKAPSSSTEHWGHNEIYFNYIYSSCTFSVRCRFFFFFFFFLSAFLNVMCFWRMKQAQQFKLILVLLVGYLRMIFDGPERDSHPWLPGGNGEEIHLEARTGRTPTIRSTSSFGDWKGVTDHHGPVKQDHSNSLWIHSHRTSGSVRLGPPGAYINSLGAHRTSEGMWIHRERLNMDDYRCLCGCGLLITHPRILRKPAFVEGAS